jgi:hypothetical protein
MQTLKNLTLLQWIGAVLVINGALNGSLNEMADLFGSVWAHHVLSICTIGSAICGGLILNFGGQGAQIRNVAAMPGVETIQVNAKANQTLAQLAVSKAPEAANVEPVQAAEVRVAAIAKGN